MENENTICEAMKRLKKEQKIISEREKEFEFICLPPQPDTIPFMIFDKKDCQNPFIALCVTDEECIRTAFFRLEKLDEKNCCATLSLLKPVDMDGFPVEWCEEFYALLKTDCCIVVDLKCFCVISPLSPKLVNRSLPIIEPK